MIGPMITDLANEVIKIIKGPKDILSAKINWVEFKVYR